MNKVWSILSVTLLVVAIGFMSACQKKDDGGGGAPGPAYIPPPAPPCVADAFGNYPAGCTPAQSSGRNAGEFVVDAGTRSTFTRMLSENVGTLESISSVYAQLPLDRMPHLPGLPGGTIYQPAPQYAEVFKCRNNGSIFSGGVCTRECNNYGNGGIIMVEVTNGTGFITLKAGPYERPRGSTCSGVQYGTEKYYSIRIPVKMFGYNGNQGFSLQSISQNTPYGGIANGTPGIAYNAVFRVTALTGTLQDNYVNVSIHYRGIPLGQAVLVRN
jgi:hypothetical protein